MVKLLGNIYTFKRVEKKYFLTPEIKKRLFDLVGDKLVLDKYGKSTISSIYLDTDDYLLIRNSIDAVSYKEKLRIRAYKTPDDNDEVFFEIKKKYKGIVYKRRISLPLYKALNYIETHKKPEESQIMSEIDYAMQFYKYPKPKMLISYDREAYYSPEEPGFRITFDSNARYRDYDIDLKLGSVGKKILDDNTIIMEVKTNGGMPLWLSSAFTELNLAPTPCSKYKLSYYDSKNYNFLNTRKDDIKNVTNF